MKNERIQKGVSRGKPFEIEVADGVVWRGVMDLVVKDEDGKIGLIDHKFLQQIGNMTATLPLNAQQLTYFKGVEAVLGKKPDWYMWNVIKKSGLRQKNNKSGVEPYAEYEDSG